MLPGCRLAAAVAAAAALLVSQASSADAIASSPGSSSRADDRVDAAVQLGSDLFIGGQFTTVDGKTHTHLAALDADTGKLDPRFSVDVNGDVSSLAASGSTLYVAGSFTTVGGAARRNVAAINVNPATGVGTVLGFKATPSAIVRSVAVSNGVAYLGGSFSTVNGVSRPYLAAVNATTGSLVSSFDPRPSASVYTVQSVGGTLYVGGQFQTIGGASRNFVAQLTTSGSATSWNAHLLPGVRNILDLTVVNGAVDLAAGGGLPAGNSAYSIDATNGNTRWQIQTDGDVQTIEVFDGVAYAGGHFDNVESCNKSGKCQITGQRAKALAVDAGSGALLDWMPRFNSPLGIWNMTAASGNLYALGDFTQVNGSSHPHIARFPL